MCVRAAQSDLLFLSAFVLSAFAWALPCVVRLYVLLRLAVRMAPVDCLCRGPFWLKLSHPGRAGVQLSQLCWSLHWPVAIYFSCLGSLLASYNAPVCFFGLAGLYCVDRHMFLVRDCASAALRSHVLREWPLSCSVLFNAPAFQPCRHTLVSAVRVAATVECNLFLLSWLADATPYIASLLTVRRWLSFDWL
eukprot:1497910-Pleurochrysis_carterae.AAC.1